MVDFADRRGDTDRYTVRRYRDGDRDGILSLYEAVGRPHSPAWFAWRFEHNPFLPSVQVVVATDSSGGVVGALPLAALRLSAPGTEVLGLRVGHPLVRPGHPRRELTTRLVADCSDYAEGDPCVRFGFVDPAADPRWLDDDARVAGAVPTCYRVQRPTAFAPRSGRLRRPPGAVDLAATWYLEARDRLATVPDDATVHRYTELPLDALWTLYRRAVPDTVHVRRDPSYYRWRFADPERPATTYVAVLDDGPTAAVVTCAGTVDGVSRVTIADLVPLRPTPGRSAATKALLAALVEEHAGADVLCASGAAVPAAAFRAFGFHPDTAFPLSAVTTPTALAVAPVTERTDADRWWLGGRRIDDATAWTVSLGDRDLA